MRPFDCQGERAAPPLVPLTVDKSFAMVLYAVALTVSMKSLLYGITPLDPLVFLSSAALLFAVALVASYVPARRAALTDPARALRAE